MHNLARSHFNNTNTTKPSVIYTSAQPLTDSEHFHLHNSTHKRLESLCFQALSWFCFSISKYHLWPIINGEIRSVGSLSNIEPPKHLTTKSVKIEPNIWGFFETNSHFQIVFNFYRDFLSFSLKFILMMHGFSSYGHVCV